MALIDTDDAGARSADMAEYGLDHLQISAEALQSGGYGAAQIMDAPWRNLGDGVKPSLASGKVDEWIAAVCGEDKVTGTKSLAGL